MHQNNSPPSIRITQFVNRITQHDTIKTEQNEVSTCDPLTVAHFRRWRIKPKLSNVSFFEMI